MVLDGKSAQKYLVNDGAPQGSILGPLFYYTLMTLLKMLSVILLSMVMILLSAQGVIKHLICGINCRWLLDLNLI